MFTRIPLRLPALSKAISETSGEDWKTEVVELRKAVNQLRKEHYGLMQALLRDRASLNSKGVIDLSQANIEASNGIQFPPTQNAQSDVNNLDDYEEGHASNSWTPTGTFATPGDLAITYTTQTGTYTKVGGRVFVDFQLVTSGFTHSTASGNFRIGGLPFTVKNLDGGWIGGLWWQGITKANYTNVVCNPRPNTTYIELYASGSGVGGAAITAADMPTGGTLILKGQASFVV